MNNKKNISKYLDFIQECKNKDYTDIITHKHHIIPLSMSEYYDGDINDEKNILKISCEDHFLAHWILANCFEINHHYHESNLRACSLLFKWSKTPEEVRKKISESRIGKCYKNKEQLLEHSKLMLGNQNALGHKHTAVTKRKISERSRISFRNRHKLIDGVFYLNNTSPKCYRFCPSCNKQIIYKNSQFANPGQLIGSKCKSCAATGTHIFKNIRKKVLNTSKIGRYNKSGGNNPRSIKLKHIKTGTEFVCIKDASAWINKSVTYVKKLIGQEFIRI